MENNSTSVEDVKENKIDEQISQRELTVFDSLISLADAALNLLSK